MALAFGEDGNEHVGPGHFLAPGRLHMNDGALQDALETGSGLGVLTPIRDEIFELRVDIFHQIAPQNVEIDIAGAHDGGRVLILDQGEQQMFQCRIFVVALIGRGQRTMEGLFEVS